MESSSYPCNNHEQFRREISNDFRSMDEKINENQRRVDEKINENQRENDEKINENQRRIDEKINTQKMELGEFKTRFDLKMTEVDTMQTDMKTLMDVTYEIKGTLTKRTNWMTILIPVVVGGFVFLADHWERISKFFGV